MYSGSVPHKTREGRSHGNKRRPSLVGYSLCSTAPPGGRKPHLNTDTLIRITLFLDHTLIFVHGQSRETIRCPRVLLRPRGEEASEQFALLNLGLNTLLLLLIKCCFVSFVLEFHLPL